MMPNGLMIADAVGQSDDGLPGGDNVAGRTVDAASGDIRLIRCIMKARSIGRLACRRMAFGLPGGSRNRSKRRRP